MRTLTVWSIALLSASVAAGCKGAPAAAVVSQGDTFAEMRTVKGSAFVTPSGDAKRAPYPRERLADGEVVSLAAGALAWIRRDAGAVWLVEGPAELTLHEDAVKLAAGRAFIDGEDGPPVAIDT